MFSRFERKTLNVSVRIVSYLKGLKLKTHQNVSKYCGWLRNLVEGFFPPYSQCFIGTLRSSQLLQDLQTTIPANPRPTPPSPPIQSATSSSCSSCCFSRAERSLACGGWGKTLGPRAFAHGKQHHTEPNKNVCFTMVCSTLFYK